jgi:hypothetical protein
LFQSTPSAGWDQRNAEFDRGRSSQSRSALTRRREVKERSELNHSPSKFLVNGQPLSELDFNKLRVLRSPPIVEGAQWDLVSFLAWVVLLAGMAALYGLQVRMVQVAL